MDCLLSGLLERALLGGGLGSPTFSMMVGRSPYELLVKTFSVSKSRSTDVFMVFFPVRWKLAILFDIILISPVESAMEFLFEPKPNGRPSRFGFRERDIISRALGLLYGIAECGKVLGLIGVTRRCSVHDASRDGFSNRSTSTFSVFCSKGQAKVSGGILCSQDNKERSESLNVVQESREGNLSVPELLLSPVA